MVMIRSFRFPLKNADTILTTSDVINFTFLEIFKMQYLRIGLSFFKNLKSIFHIFSCSLKQDNKKIEIFCVVLL